MNKEQMLSELRAGVCTVSFTKVNGEARVMPCTLVESNIPEAAKPKGSGKEKSDDVVSVFSIDTGAWRSFRVENVTSFVNSIGEELYD
jgi:hypothetical protein